MATQRAPTLDFAHHERRLGDNLYIYPVVSRRAGGLSIGVNLNPDKVCNFDCPYCQVDRTIPPRVRDVELPVLQRELDAVLALVASGQLWQTPPFDTVAPALRRVADIAFAGDGEPTAYAGFGEAIDIAGRCLVAHGLAVAPVVLTNATLLHRPRVQQALDRLYALGGEVWAKLDAGTEAWFRRVDGTKLKFSRVVDNIRDTARRHPLVIQSMFHRFDDEEPSEAEIAAYIERLREVRDAGGQIRLVQVYSVARAPADPRVHALPVERLAQIAAQVRALGLPAEVYPGGEI